VAGHERNRGKSGRLGADRGRKARPVAGWPAGYRGSTDVRRATRLRNVHVGAAARNGAGGQASKTRLMPEPTPALTCREAVDLLADYLGGDLAAGQRAAVEAHLVECRECVAYFGSYRSAIHAVREIGQCDDGATREVPEEVVRGIIAHWRAATSGAG
jgi:hypothetical protein